MIQNTSETLCNSSPEESPEEVIAFEAFLAAYCLPDREWADGFWNVMQSHRNARYRRVAARYLATSQWQGKRPRLPIGTTPRIVILELAREDPYDQGVAFVIERLLSRMGNCQRRRLQAELLNSIPDPSTLRTMLQREN